MASKDYLKMVEENRRKHLKLTKKQYKRIVNLFEDAAKELGEKAARSGKKSLDRRWALEYKKSIESTVEDLKKQLNTIIITDMKTAAEIGTAINTAMFEVIDKKYSLGVSEKFKSVFASVPKEVMEELISGRYYEDGKGLSERIWFSGQKVNGEIDYIIQQGMIQKKSALELAKDLEMYVNPLAVKSFELGKVYPLLRGKRVEFNSYRLGVTSISHSFQLSTIRSCGKNPFVEGIEWRSALAHGRTCSKCEERNGQIFPINDTPLDHPMGMCVLIPHVEKSLDDVAEELRDWMGGSVNPALDNWYNEFGNEFAL